MALSFSVPDTELSLTLENRRPGVVDNIFTGTAFLSAMRNRGGVETLDGGREISQPLLMSKNTTAGSFSGFDILDVTPQNNETSALYQWANVYVSISIAWDEEQRNMGRSQVINLVNQKIDDAELSLRDQINIQLMQAQPGAGSKDLNSITEIIDEVSSGDPARTSAIGAIGNANTWWRNIFTTGGAFVISDMNAMWNDVSDGIDFPSFLFTHSTPFEYYENALTGQIRFGDTTSADAGFDNLLYKSVPLMWDPQLANTDEIYFINTKYLKLYIKAGADFQTTPFVKPANQMARTAQIASMMQLVSSNRRRLGTLHGITAPA